MKKSNSLRLGHKQVTKIQSIFRRKTELNGTLSSRSTPGI